MGNVVRRGNSCNLTGAADLSCNLTATTDLSFNLTGAADLSCNFTAAAVPVAIVLIMQPLWCNSDNAIFV